MTVAELAAALLRLPDEWRNVPVCLATLDWVILTGPPELTPFDRPVSDILGRPIGDRVVVLNGAAVEV